MYTKHNSERCLFQLVHDGLLDLSVGIERSGISEDEFKIRLEQLA